MKTVLFYYNYSDRNSARWIFACAEKGKKMRRKKDEFEIIPNSSFLELEIFLKRYLKPIKDQYGKTITKKKMKK